MDTVFKDLAVIIRSLFKRRSFTAVVVVTLTLGIGACAAVFTVVNSVLLRPLPFADAQHLVLISSLNKDAGGKIEEYGVSLSDLLDWRDRARSLSSLAGMQPTEVAFTGFGDPEQVEAGMISTNLFATLGVRPFAGRFFEVEKQVDKSNVVIIGYDLWQRRFGGSLQVLNRTVIIDGIARQIIGITPRDFFFAANAEVWIPLNLSIPRVPRTLSRNTAVVGRLKPGVNVEGASNEIKVIAEQLAREHPVNAGWSAKALPIREPYVRDVKRVLIYLFAAVFFVLLIVCVNVANLVLVRNVERHPELVLRLALGATRRELLRQEFVENLALTGCGAVLGLALAALSIKPIIALSPIIGSSPAGNRILGSVTFDFRVVLFILIISVFTALALTVVSFLRISKTNLVDPLKSGARSMMGTAYERNSQKLFVVAQLSVSFLLLFAASLMLKSFWSLRNIDAGFKTEGLLTARISLPAVRYETHEKRAEFQRQMIEKIQNLPGVSAASTTTRLPLNEFAMTTLLEVDGIVAPEGGFVANFRRIGPSYFRTLGTAILHGREFTRGDTPTSLPVAIISREMEKRFWPNQSAIGKRIRRQSQTDRNWRTVVGVVQDVKDSSLTEGPALTFYVPYYQSSIPSFHVVIRTAKASQGIIPLLRNQVRQLDNNLPLFRIATAEELFLDSLSRPRFAAYLLVAFAFIGLFVAIIGVYGVVSYTTSRRVNEIGVRMAIGAQQKSILLLILKQSGRLTLWGIVVGIVISMIVERSVTSLWEATGSTNIYIGAAALVTFFALLSSLLPALRATRVSPMSALRYQ